MKNRTKNRPIQADLNPESTQEESADSGGAAAGSEGDLPAGWVGGDRGEMG